MAKNKAPKDIDLFPGYRQNEKGEIRHFETEDDIPEKEKDQWKRGVKWPSQDAEPEQSEVPAKVARGKAKTDGPLDL